MSDHSLFKRAFIDFLAEFGHRGVYELEIFHPRWRENPTFLLDIIKNSIETADLNKIQEQQKLKADQAWKEISAKISFYHKATPNLLPRVGLSILTVATIKLYLCSIQ